MQSLRGRGGGAGERPEFWTNGWVATCQRHSSGPAEGDSQAKTGKWNKKLIAAFESVLESLDGVLETTRVVAAEYGALNASRPHSMLGSLIVAHEFTDRRTAPPCGTHRARR